MEPDILDSLTNKLVDLETRAAAYREQLNAEFKNYYRHLLAAAHNTSPSIASDIHQSIVATFTSYPNLRPNLEPADSLALDSPKPAATFQLSAKPTNSGNTSLTESSETSESTRDRDRELQGLFTPSYLRLFDSVNHHHHHHHHHQQLPGSGSTNPDTPPSTSSQPPETGDRIAPGIGNDAIMDSASASNPANATPTRSLPPLQTSDSDDRPGRPQLADDTDSTADSERSDSKVIRSALRRSSSTSKTPQSPRRVRFEVMGTEVLPTSSPQPPTYITPRTDSPTPSADMVSSDSLLDEDSEEDAPPPRKISSSDALRALSRAPLDDDGTVWTVVNADEEEVVSQPSPPRSGQETSLPRRPAGQGGASQLSSAISGSTSGIKAPPLDEVAMAQARFKTNGSPIVSGTSSPRPPASPKPKKSAADEHDDMFHFETESGQNTPRRPGSPINKHIDEDDDQDDSDSEEELAMGPKRPPKRSSAVSHSVTINKGNVTQPMSPETSKFRVGSIGSYKGKAVIMPVVKDAALHQRAESLGEFNSFVGSMDGTSGMDPADISSYRASLARGGFVGTPRSFTERLMMEEMQAEREQQKAETK